MGDYILKWKLVSLCVEYILFIVKLEGNILVELKTCLFSSKTERVNIKRKFFFNWLLISLDNPQFADLF